MQLKAQRKHIVIGAVAAGLIAVSVILVALAPAGQSPAAGPPAGAPPPGAPGREERWAQAVSVGTAAAEVKTLRPYLDVNGDVAANVSVDVYPDIGGKLVAFSVGIGDSVSKGDAIARIDPSTPGASYSINFVPSPIAGTVTDILVDRGATVSTATAVARVGIISDLKITVNLPEGDSAKVDRGMTGAAEFAALPGETFPAAVTRVSPVLNPKNRTREIVLAFVKRDPRIRAGMFCRLRLYTAPVSGRVVVPGDAVFLQNDAQYVYVAVEKGGSIVAEKRAVKTGAAVDDDVVVAEGVAAGEQVIVEGQGGLSDGVKISVLKEAAQ